MKNRRYCTAFILLIFGVVVCVLTADARDNIVKNKGSQDQAAISHVYTQNGEGEEGQTDEGQMGQGDDGQRGQADQGQQMGGQGDEGQQSQADEGQDSE